MKPVAAVPLTVPPPDATGVVVVATALAGMVTVCTRPGAGEGPLLLVVTV